MYLGIFYPTQRRGELLVYKFFIIWALEQLREHLEITYEALLGANERAKLSGLYGVQSAILRLNAYSTEIVPLKHWM